MACVIAIASLAWLGSVSARASSDADDSEDTAHAALKTEIGSLSQEERESRLAHAHELLGKYYKHSIVRTGEQVEKINGMIYRWTFRALPKAYKKGYKKVAQTIIDESLKHDFDPVFLMAVISNESSFIPTRKGRFGEIGLMQLKPSTGKWIAKRAGLKWRGKKSLRDPITNIKLGSAYLAFLREKFDSQARLYLAAYNMGQGNVEDALDRKIWPKEYPAHVMQHYIDFYAELDSKDQ